MDVSRESLMDLLELQKVDSRIHRLEHGLANLPEAAELEQLQARRAELAGTIDEARTVVHDHAKQQKRLEDEIDSIVTKLKQEDLRLYGGTVTNPRELAAMQGEIEALRRRQSSLEDEDLEVLEARETAEGRLRELESEAEALDASIAEATGRRDVAVAGIDGELAEARSERAGWVPKFDAGLLGLYDRLREQMIDHVAAAPLLDGSCQGCHMRLPSQEYERVRDSTGLIRCDECGRILVVVRPKVPTADAS
ncbi:MAG: zinc ribbon domain-containing protein [Actinomycetota bacterium]